MDQSGGRVWSSAVRRLVPRGNSALDNSKKLTSWKHFAMQNSGGQASSFAQQG
jgi:hypothetical protein